MNNKRHDPAFMYLWLSILAIFQFNPEMGDFHSFLISSRRKEESAPVHRVLDPALSGGAWA